MNLELDKYLCKKYPKICVNRHKSPMESLFCFGFETSDGWGWLIDNLFNFIQSRIDNNPHLNIFQFEVSQIKSKWARLRIYHSGGDEVIGGAVDFAEYLSGSICEECGSQDKVGRTTKGWLVTECYKCMKKNKHELFWRENE